MRDVSAKAKAAARWLVGTARDLWRVSFPMMACLIGGAFFHLGIEDKDYWAAGAAFFCWSWALSCMKDRAESAAKVEWGMAFFNMIATDHTLDVTVTYKKDPTP